jgi:thioredoxin reductase (NADPH)
MKKYDIIIIGAGPGGLAAGIYAARRNMKTLILERGVIGGQMALATEIENYPGVEKTQGMNIAKTMEKQAREFGCEIRMEEVVEMDLENKAIATNAGRYGAKAVILATGGGHKKLDIENEDKFLGRGVSYCATCDAPFFRGKKVAVVGGSDSAIMAALFIADYARETYLIHRREEFRAEGANQDKLKKSKVKVLTNKCVVRVEGDKKVERIVLKDMKDNKETKMDVDGLFIYIGTLPTTELAKKAGIKLDKLGYIEANSRKETNIRGVFAIGDATGGIWQVAQAVGDGAVAAVNAYNYIKNLK